MCVRTVSVLRGGVPYTTEELVAAFEPSAGAATAAEEDWIRIAGIFAAMVIQRHRDSERLQASETR